MRLYATLDKEQKLPAVSRQLTPGQTRGNLRDILPAFNPCQSPPKICVSSLRCKKQLWIQLQLLDSGGGVDCASRYFEEGQVGIVALALNSGGGGQASRGCSEQGEEAAKETAKV